LYAFSPGALPANPAADFEGKFCIQIMRANSEEIHCCSLLQMEGVLTLRTSREEHDVSKHNHSTSEAVGAEIVGSRVLAKESVLEKRWPMAPDRVANLLADLVFVMLMLLLFVWIGLWTFIH